MARMNGIFQGWTGFFPSKKLGGFDPSFEGESRFAHTRPNAYGIKVARADKTAARTYARTRAVSLPQIQNVAVGRGCSFAEARRAARATCRSVPGTGPRRRSCPGWHLESIHRQRCGEQTHAKGRCFAGGKPQEGPNEPTWDSSSRKHVYHKHVYHITNM